MDSTSPRTVVRRPKGPENKWTPEEDQILTAAIASSGSKVCWRKVAQSLPGRTNKSCRKRWIHSLDPTLKKGRWTAAEDKILLNAISVHGTVWYKVAKYLPGRTDDQAAKRFREKLDPSIARNPWTEEEDTILINVWRQVGKRWNLISRALNGRPAVHCRNRWQSLLRIGKIDTSEDGNEFDPAASTNLEVDDGFLAALIENGEMQRPSTASSFSSVASSNLSPVFDASDCGLPTSHSTSDGEQCYCYSPNSLPMAWGSPSGHADTMNSTLDSRRLRVEPCVSSSSNEHICYSAQLSGPDNSTPTNPTMGVPIGGQERCSHCVTPFPFNSGHQMTPEAPSSFPSPYDLPPITSQHDTSGAFQTPNQLPNARQSNEFMMTCPVALCDYQSTNLIELWKHVTWSHVNPPTHSSPSCPPPAPNNVDPAVLDYFEQLAVNEQYGENVNFPNLQVGELRGSGAVLPASRPVFA